MIRFGCICRRTFHQRPMTEQKWRECQSFWRVVQRECNHSKFNGSRRTPSDYSELVCLRCGAHWRTKAMYVGAIKDISEDETQKRLRGELS